MSPDASQPLPSYAINMPTGKIVSLRKWQIRSKIPGERTRMESKWCIDGVIWCVLRTCALK